MAQLKQMLKRLTKPSVVLSIVSQVVAIFILLGYNINENTVMAVATAICSILVLLGIMHNPDTQKKGYGDDLLPCAGDGSTEQHVLINGELVCTTCGAVYNPQPQGQPEPKAQSNGDAASQ